MHIYDTLVIGGGPGGYAAALYAARAGLSCLVFEKMSVGGQLTLTDTVENYPGFDEGIDGFTLGMRMQSGAERFGAITKYEEVISLGLTEQPKRIVTTEGEYYAHTVVLATGAVPRKLGFAREDDFVGRGVHYCAHCDGRFYRGRTVVVVGGGNSAVEDALYLSDLAERVYLVHRRDTLRAEGILAQAILERENVSFLPNMRLSELLGEDKISGALIEDVKTGEKRELCADGVFVSIGRTPVSELFSSELETDAGGYVVADESTRTAIAGVMAVGDLRTKPLRQIVTAVADGAVAVHYIKEYLTLVKK